MTDTTPPSVRPPPPEILAPGVLVPALVLLIVVGYALFARGIGTVAGNELGGHRALMVAVNAATLTGFQTARNPGDYTPAGQVITLALMVGGTLFSLVGGGLAVVRIARLPYRDRTIAAAAVIAVPVVLLIGGIAGRGQGRSAFDGAYQAASAFGNCGLYVGRLPRGGDSRVLWLLLPLAAAGSVGVPVLLDLCGLRPSPHTRSVLTASATAYLLTLAMLLPLLAWHDPPPVAAAVRALAHGEATLPESVRLVLLSLQNPVLTASREAINARSAGFPFQFVTSLPIATTVVLLVAMVIGGGPGGTAGGVKVTTVAVLAAGVASAIRGRPTTRAFGVAVGWVVAYVATMLTAMVALLLADPELPADRVLFLAASALGNVGLSHDPVSPSMAGMYVLSITMLAGRVLPVLVLWTIADRMPDVTSAIG